MPVPEPSTRDPQPMEHSARHVFKGGLAIESVGGKQFEIDETGAAIALPGSAVAAAPAGGAIAWTSATLIVQNTIVSNAGTLYLCNVTHTSAGTFAGDAASFTAMGGVPASVVSDTRLIAATTGQVPVKNADGGWAPGAGGGSPSARTAGIYGRGFSVPPGTLDTFRASIRNAANELCEIVVFGDSTTSGSCFDPPANSNGIYSWLQRLRANIATAGYPYGGRGVVASNEIAAGMNPDGITAISAISGFAASDNNGVLLTDTLKSTAGGDSVTIQGKGTTIRLLVATQAAAGGFTYSIDGGAATTVEGTIAANFLGMSVLAASGLAPGTHTVTITNLGGSLTLAPTIQANGTGGFGSGANTFMADSPQAYDYIVTGVYAGGETAAGSALTRTQTFTGANRVSLGISIFNNGALSYNLYRRNSGAGVYGLVANFAPSGGAGITSGFTNISDTGSINPNTATNPPVTSTVGRTAANSIVQVAPVFLGTTGVAVQKFGISGISSTSYFGTGVPALGNYQAQLALGQVPGVPGSGQTYGYSQPEGAHPQYARARLSIFALGINDMNGSVSAATLRDSIAIWARMVRSAGADPLLVIPHYTLAINNYTLMGEFVSASASTAQAMSIPFVDFGEAIGPASQWGANNVAPTVHTNQNAYNLEADFLWNKVLLPYITSA